MCGSFHRVDLGDDGFSPTEDMAHSWRQQYIPAKHIGLFPPCCAVGFQELELGRVIGEGSFGQVWLAKYCQTPGGGLPVITAS